MLIELLKKPYRRFKIWQKNQRFETCSPDTLPAVQEAFRLTKSMDGDYYEFGLYKGYLFLQADAFAREQEMKGIHFFGFDSFEGLPVIEGRDANWRFKQGQYACSFERVKKNLEKRGLSWDDHFLIKGFYSETLTDPTIRSRYPFGKARVVVVDCDLYSSTKDVLAFIYPYLQNGTVLIMDDWNCFDRDNEKGERKATAEFLVAHPNIQLEHLGDFGWHCASFRVQMA